MNEQITTIAELDALPVGSIAARICSDGQGNVAYSLTSEGWFPTWSYSLMRGASMRSVDMHHIGPLTVLYRPDAPERTEPTEEQVQEAVFSALRAKRPEESGVIHANISIIAARAILALFGSQPTVAEVRAQALKDAADAYPAITRDMVSRGSVKAWLRARAERGEA